LTANLKLSVKGGQTPAYAFGDAFQKSSSSGGSATITTLSVSIVRGIETRRQHHVASSPTETIKVRVKSFPRLVVALTDILVGVFHGHLLGKLLQSDHLRTKERFPSSSRS
jgi:hypothetical protein